MIFAFSVIDCSVKEINDQSLKSYERYFDNLEQADIASLTQLKYNIINELHYYPSYVNKNHLVNRVFLNELEELTLESINEKLNLLKIKNPEYFL